MSKERKATAQQAQQNARGETRYIFLSAATSDILPDSLMTSEMGALRIFRGLRKRYPSW